jgi:quercetin dioxygenase-like cupin family protein
MMLQREFLTCTALLLLIVFPSKPLAAQGVVSPSGVCKPASMRTQQVGCWILADDPIGALSKAEVFWALDVYPTRAAAEADKGPRATVLESLGRVWLLTIEEQKAKPAHGSRAAEIGPLGVVAGQKYSVQYMEAIFTPGMTAPEHLHFGPEAWYTEAGETCLETSDGHIQIGRPNAAPVIVPEGLSMHLTATGTEQRQVAGADPASDGAAAVDARSSLGGEGIVWEEMRRAKADS